jgi:glucokinase
MPSFAIGVDLGGTNMRVAVVDDTGRLLETISKPTALAQGREHVVREISGAIRQLLPKFSRSHGWLGVGVGVPGIIDLERGTVDAAANLPGWNEYPVRHELEMQLGVRVLLENDANCAALGEKWTGAGRDVNDLCMITLGTGVGGGFVVGSKPWHGVTGMAGEIGHMTVIPDGAPCACGSRGCLEQYASATAICRMAMDAVAKGTAPVLAEALARHGQKFDAQIVFECAQRGEPAAGAIFETVGKTLGIALGNLINVLNLPLHVVGGGVAKAWDAFSPALMRELKSRSIVFRAGEPRKSQHRATVITRTMLGENAGLLGAARLPMLAEKSAWCSLAV